MKANMTDKKKNMERQSKTKPPVDREAVRVLAIELGAREAARRLGIKESTVLSWARRYNWKLPKRKGGGSNAITPQSNPGDALIATHEELEGRTRSALATAIAKAAEAVAFQ
jgi:Putative ATPase subunit of terminase (gpP-like)